MAPANAGAKGKPRLLQQPGFLLPASIEMLTKSWDEENAPAAMMMRELSGRHLFKFIRFQMIADTWQMTRRSSPKNNSPQFSPISRNITAMRQKWRGVLALILPISARPLTANVHHALRSCAQSERLDGASMKSLESILTRNRGRLMEASGIIALTPSPRYGGDSALLRNAVRSVQPS